MNFDVIRAATLFCPYDFHDSCVFTCRSSLPRHRWCHPCLYSRTPLQTIRGQGRMYLARQSLETRVVRSQETRPHHRDAVDVIASVKKDVNTVFDGILALNVLQTVLIGCSRHGSYWLSFLSPCPSGSCACCAEPHPTSLSCLLGAFPRGERSSPEVSCVLETPWVQSSKSVWVPILHRSS